MSYKEESRLARTAERSAAVTDQRKRWMLETSLLLEEAQASKRRMYISTASCETVALSFLVAHGQGQLESWPGVAQRVTAERLTTLSLCEHPLSAPSTEAVSTQSGVNLFLAEGRKIETSYVRALVDFVRKARPIEDFPILLLSPVVLEKAGKRVRAHPWGLRLAAPLAGECYLLARINYGQVRGLVEVNDSLTGTEPVEVPEVGWPGSLESLLRDVSQMLAQWDQRPPDDKADVAAGIISTARALLNLSARALWYSTLQLELPKAHLADEIGDLRLWQRRVLFVPPPGVPDPYLDPASWVRHISTYLRAPAHFLSTETFTEVSPAGTVLVEHRHLFREQPAQRLAPGGAPHSWLCIRARQKVLFLGPGYMSRHQTCIWAQLTPEDLLLPLSEGELEALETGPFLPLLLPTPTIFSAVCLADASPFFQEAPRRFLKRVPWALTAIEAQGPPDHPTKDPGVLAARAALSELRSSLGLFNKTN